MPRRETAKQRRQRRGRAPRGDLPVDPVVLPFLRETAWKQFCANAKTLESTHHAAYETVSRLSSTVVSNPCANDGHFLSHYVSPANRRKEREPTSGLEPLTYPHYEL